MDLNAIVQLIGGNLFGMAFGVYVYYDMTKRIDKLNDAHLEEMKTLMGSLKDTVSENTKVISELKTYMESLK